MFEIEDVPVAATTRAKTGLTKQIGQLQIGQSILTDRSYQAIYSLVRAAKVRIHNPLLGEFSIVPEGGKFRVGRTS